MKKTARSAVLPLRLLNSELLRDALIQFPQREPVDLDADDDEIRARQSLGAICRIFKLQFGIAMFDQSLAKTMHQLQLFFVHIHQNDGAAVKVFRFDKVGNQKGSELGAAASEKNDFLIRRWRHVSSGQVAGILGSACVFILAEAVFHLQPMPLRAQLFS